MLLLHSFLLLPVSIATGVMYALTWNTSLTIDAGVTQDAKEADNVATVVLITLPVLIWMIVSCILGKRYQRMKIEKKIMRESILAEKKRVASLLRDGDGDGGEDGVEKAKDAVGNDSVVVDGVGYGGVKKEVNNEEKEEKLWVENESCGRESPASRQSL